MLRIKTESKIIAGSLTRNMKLTNKENFIISSSCEALIESVYHVAVISAIIDQYGKMLTLKLDNNKSVFIEARNQVANQYLSKAIEKITAKFIEKQLKEVLDYDYGGASRIR